METHTSIPIKSANFRGPIGWPIPSFMISSIASTAATSNEPGPDLADYPMDTVPNKVDQLTKAQDFHHRNIFPTEC